MTILFIAINYDTNESTLKLVNSFQNEKQEDVSMLIVDNSEFNNCCNFRRVINSVDPDIRVISSPKNLGYFGGANYGYLQYLENHCAPDWTIVSNVDLEFVDGNFFKELAIYSHTTDKLGIVAPSIMSTQSRRDLNPRLLERPNAKTMNFYTIAFQNVWFLNAYELLAHGKNLLRSLVRDKTSFDQGVEKAIYAPQGSCIAFSKLFFERGGTLSYPMFLFGEEIFVAEQAREMNLNVMYNPRMKCIHNDHVSTGLLRSRKISQYVYESAIYIANTYFDSTKKSNP